MGSKRAPESGSRASAAQPPAASAPPARGWMRRLGGCLMEHRTDVILSLVAALFGSAVKVVTPLIAREIVDDVVGKANAPLAPWLVLLIALALAGFGFAYLRRYRAGRAALNVQNDLRNRMHDHLQTMDAATLDTMPTGQLVARANSDTGLVLGLLNFYPLVSGNLLMMLLSLAVMFVLSPLLALVSLAVLPALLVISYRMRRRVFPASWDAQQREGDLAEIVDENVAGVRVVKAFGQETRELERLADSAVELYGSQMRSTRIQARYQPMLEAIPSLGQVGILALGGYLALHGGITLGTFLAFSAYIAQLMAPTRQLAGILTIAQQARAGVERIFQLLDMRPRVTDAPDAAALAPDPAEIVFENVRFAYPVERDAALPEGAEAPSAASRMANAADGANVPDSDERVRSNGDSRPERRHSVDAAAAVDAADAADVAADAADGPTPHAAVLDGLDLRIRAGERVAIVGASGSGKSTIVRLLARFYDADAGRVTVGGHDVRSVTLESLRRTVGLAFEDSFLFSESVRENIAFGDPDASEDRIVAAARAAQADGFIRALPRGYDTVVGERGLSLSGGQRQRIALARVLLRDPGILVLDDATSAIDARTEQAIHDELRAVMRNRTVLIIAHRHSTLHLADRIVVLEDGRVADDGTHDELIERNATYRALFLGEEDEDARTGDIDTLAAVPATAAGARAGSALAASAADVRADSALAASADPAKMPVSDESDRRHGDSRPERTPSVEAEAEADKDADAEAGADAGAAGRGTPRPAASPAAARPATRTTSAPSLGAGLGRGGGGWRSGLAPTPELLARVAELQPVKDVPRIRISEEGRAQPDFSLGALLREFRKPLAAALVFVVIDAVAGLLGPALVKTGVDEGVVTGTTGVLFGASLLYLLVVLADLANGIAEAFVTGRVAQRVMLSLRIRIFAQLQRLSLDYYEREMAGRIMTRMTTDVDQFEQLLENGLLGALVAIVTFVGVGVALVVIDLPLGLAVLSVIVPLAIATYFFRRRASRLYDLSRERIAVVNAAFQEGLSGVRESQAFTHERATMARFHGHGARYLDSRVAAQRLVATYFPFVQFLSSVADAIVLGLGAVLIASGHLTTGALIAFMLYIDMFFSPIQQLSQVFDAWQQTRVSVSRIGGLMRIETLTPDPEHPVAVPSLAGELRFDDVHFAYPTAPVAAAEVRGPRDARPALAPDALVTRPTEALAGIRLEVRPGETVALVGETGAGKTTMMKLVARFYDPDAGSVAADGIDLRAFRLGSYRRQLGYVPQESFLFTGTIADNIAYGRPDATAAQVRAAADAVGAHRMIRTLPGGYDHVVSERGRSLSAGQRQLIALARAQLVDPAILLLDEATSNLDLATEARVTRAMNRLTRGRTTVLIAHRLQTAMGADRIVMLDHGRIIEVGSHDELVAAGGQYAAMWHAFEDATARPGAS